MTRVVVIGTGFGARVVAPSYAAAGAEVIDVVSARDEMATLAACRRADVDIVSVHAPPFLHAACVSAALEAGNIVLCDKPFGTEETDLVSMADHDGYVNFEFRFHPARIALRDLVRSGRIGSVEHISWIHHTAGSRVPLRPHGWLFETAAGGGWAGAWSSHVLDAVRWVTGAEIDDVAGTRRQAIVDRPSRDGVTRRGDAEDGFTASLTLDSGATVGIDSTFAAPRSLPSRVDVIGSDGLISVVADEQIVVRLVDGTKQELTIPALAGDPHLGPMQVLAAHLVAMVRGGSPHADLATFADGRACRRALDRVLDLPLRTRAAR